MTLFLRRLSTTTNTCCPLHGAIMTMTSAATAAGQIVLHRPQELLVVTTVGTADLVDRGRVNGEGSIRHSRRRVPSLYYQLCNSGKKNSSIRTSSELGYLAAGSNSPLLQFTASEHVISSSAVLFASGVSPDHTAESSSSNIDDGNDKPKSAVEKPDKATLEKVAEKIGFDLNNLFVRNPDLSVYRNDVIFENRISGKTTQGLLAYSQQMHTLKILAHLRYVFVRFNVTGMKLHPEEGTIELRWKIVALKFLKMTLMYFPKQLWKKTNLNTYADPIAEGISTFHIDGEGKIFKHVVDNKMEDKGPEVVKQVDKIKEKLQKLKEAGVPAPSM